MFRNAALLGARVDDRILVAEDGVLLDSEGYVVDSATAETSWGAGLATDAGGLVGTPQDFLVTTPKTLSGALPVYLRVPWRIGAAAGGGAPFAAIRADLLVDGVSVANGVGAARDASATDDFSEMIELIPANPVNIAPGGTFGVRLQPQITTPSGAPGSTFEPLLSHNPQAPENQLVFELVGGKSAEL